MQKFIPKLFSTEMVNAILEDRKTQTRRVFKNIPRLSDNIDTSAKYLQEDPTLIPIYCPHGKPGDIIWVRETLYQNGELGLEYHADGEAIDEDIIPIDFKVLLDKNGRYKFGKIPSIYMEKWACRLFLEITDIKLERLQDISEGDSSKEGIVMRIGGVPPYEESYQVPNSPNLYYTAKQAFKVLWESINGKDSWKINPYVWAITFKRIEKPKNF